MKVLIQGNLEMSAQGPDLIKRNPFLSPDSPVSAVIADIQQFGDLINQRNMGRKIILDMLKKKLLNVRMVHGLVDRLTG
jgi:hypothetical protein